MKNGVPKGVQICPASLSKEGDVPQHKTKNQEGIKPLCKCKRCRACWDKNNGVIAYVRH